MNITIVIVSTALASTIGASIATFLLQKYYDRRLEYYFNSRLEELKATLKFQGDITNQIVSRRLEIYPHVAELIYRLRNTLKDMFNPDLLTLEEAVSFIRLVDQYTEQIFSARFYLEFDGIFVLLHEYKILVLNAKSLLLDWITLTRESSLSKDKDIALVTAKLREAYNKVDHQHQRLIHNLAKLGQSAHQ